MLTLKHVTRYLMGTLGGAIFFKRFTRNLDDLKILCYVDSDWAGSEARKSTSGGIIMIADCQLATWSRGQIDHRVKPSSMQSHMDVRKHCT
jgi:hypothetical protein